MLLKINVVYAVISGFRVTRHTCIFLLFLRNQIQCCALNSFQALLNFRRTERVNKQNILERAKKEVYAEYKHIKYLAQNVDLNFVLTEKRLANLLLELIIRHYQKFIFEFLKKRFNSTVYEISTKSK